jgi:hypothetical protein
MCEENFSDFIESIFENRNFDWRALLGFVPERGPVVSKERRYWESLWELSDPEQVNWKRSPETAWECFERWLEDSGISGIDYLCIEERRASGHVRFHLMIDDRYMDPTSALPIWNRISGGWAYPQACGDKLKGLIGNKVMREGCTLYVNRDGERRRYTSEDFRPWRPKD